MFDSGMVAGSISLVAPELKQGQPPSPATDIYAFGGIMLWVELLLSCLLIYLFIKLIIVYNFHYIQLFKKYT